MLTRAWNIVTMNKAFTRLFAFFIESPSDFIVARNVMHSLFHPQGIRPFVTNWEEVAGFTRLSLFSTLTTLGTPLDVTAQELRIESYFPTDDATGEWPRKSAASASN